MIVPHEKCMDCRAYAKGVCPYIWAYYDAQSPEQLEKAEQGIRDCDNDKAR